MAARKWMTAARQRLGVFFGCAFVALIVAVALGGPKIGSGRARASIAPTDFPAASSMALPEIVPAAPMSSREEQQAERPAQGQSLVVRVVDAGGAPQAGQDVLMSLDFGYGAEALGAPVRSDKDGLATFANLRTSVESYGSGMAMLEVGFAGPNGPPVSLRFSSRRIPERVLTLVLPDRASLPSEVASALESEGNLVREDELVSLVAGAKGPVGSVQDELSGQRNLQVAQAPIQIPSEPKPELVPLVPASVVGRLLVDADVPLDILRVELEEVLPAGRHKAKFHYAQAPQKDGIFRFEGVSPGLIAIRVSLWGRSGALAWVDEIELEEGEEQTDPALCEVDLTGRLFSANVEVLDEYGLRIEPAVVMPFSPRTGERGTPRIQSEGATPRVWMDPTGMDLHVVAPDFEPRQLRLDPDARDFDAIHQLALTRRSVTALELRFLDRELLDGLPKGYLLRAELRRPDGLRYPWDELRHRGEFDVEGRLRLGPADCGVFHVHLSLVSPDGESRELARQADRVEVGPAAASELGTSASSVRVVHLRGFSSSLRVSK